MTTETTNPQSLDVGAVTPGNKTSENKFAWVSIALACLLAIIPIVAKAVPADSVWAVILASLGAIVTTVGTYFGSRAYVKGKASLAKGIFEAAKAGPAKNP